ncbi:MAG TPA: biotin carboxylase N-terminal domain-containing protein [Ilumatobacteraceae bacterium]|nr:biotin carboxylase N-terminal domain-containing protein [Ilumatobacteraceae bacterium]
MENVPVTGPVTVPITRLLIANRGEIAVRIARTAHRLGISTVGVYSEPDANALHVDSVDVAIALGGSTPAESYLRGDAIIDAALASGADAVHPGYGFLAENASFAQAVIDAGLVWVGPTPEQVTLLGDKVAAKRAALEAGVPTTSMIEVVDGRVADTAEVTYPALVKAAAGGGGRGMRVVRSADELDDAVEAASREALAAFGDGAVFIEPYLERGRHVEVQVFGDRYGNVVHLGERECSIQRRNQKVVEESPSAGISDEVRTTLCEGAVALARHVGYEGAGTVEFMIGADAHGAATITFLEVNTRLQVEHPVTEAVTGLDLVELQLRVAAGEALPITQADVSVTGHAIEVRVVAEDPSAGWMPSTGRIGRFSIGGGTGQHGTDPWCPVRVDTGVRDGAEISSDYDSLVAKVIAHAPTRVEAARQLARALRGSQITGINTNLDSLVAILGEADYLAADTPTAYLDEHPDVLTPPGPAGDDRVALLLGAVFALEAERRSADRATPFAPSGWRNLRTQGQRQVWVEQGGDHLHVEYVMRPRRHTDGSTQWTASVWLGPWPVPDETGALQSDDRIERLVRLLDRRADSVALEIDGRRCVVGSDIVHHTLGVDDDGIGAVTVHTRSAAGALTLTKAPRFVLHDAQAEGGGPVCPLPGTVIAVHVAAGDSVTDGQVLMVVEAMKMEHKILAPGDGTVAEVRFAVGDRVDQGDLLVALDHGDPGDHGDQGDVT